MTDVFPYTRYRAGARVQPERSRAGYEKQKGALIGSSIAPEIKSQIMADAATYAPKHFPDATRHFGVEKPEQLADLATALLPKIEAERPIAATPTGGAVP